MLNCPPLPVKTTPATKVMTKDGELPWSLNYNLFNGMRDKARLQGAAYQINEAMDIRNNALRVLNENLNLAWNARRNARLQTPKARDYAEYSASTREALTNNNSAPGQRTFARPARQ